MPLVARAPDLAMALPLDPFAPRAARHHVAQVDRPSPDLRNTVLLLVSDLVTGAVEASVSGTIELRVWMPSDLVRVEIEGAAGAIERAPRHPQGYVSRLLDELADRWELEHAEDSDGAALIWFEIDRRASAASLNGHR
jgi:hypothetical protein